MRQLISAESRECYRRILTVRLHPFMTNLLCDVHEVAFSLLHFLMIELVGSQAGLRPSARTQRGSSSCMVSRSAFRAIQASSAAVSNR